MEVITGTVLDGAQALQETKPPTAYAVVIALDCSSSMYGLKLQEAKKAIGVLINAMTANSIQLGLVSFGVVSQVICPLTIDCSQINDAMAALMTFGGTPMDKGIQLSHDALLPATERDRILILVTDGQPNDAVAAAAVAKQATAAGNRVIAVGVGNDVWESYLQYEIASQPADYFYADRAAAIGSIFSNILELYILQTEAPV